LELLKFYQQKAKKYYLKILLEENTGFSTLWLHFLKLKRTAYFNHVRTETAYLKKMRHE